MESEPKFIKKEDVSMDDVDKEIRKDAQEAVFGNVGRERYKPGNLLIFGEESSFDKAEEIYQKKIQNEKDIEEVKQRIVDQMNKGKGISSGIKADDELYKSNRGILKDHLNQNNKAA